MTREHLEVAAAPTLERIRSDIMGKPPKVAQMLDHMAANLFDPGLNVTTLKKALDLRDNSIAVRFHQTVGAPPKLYISQRRCRVAARLLRTTQLRVWVIAELTGYASLGVFSKAFAKVVGLRPTKYRQLHRGGEVEQATPAPNFYSTTDLAAALAGKLAEAKVKALVEAILSAYPGLRIDP